MNVLFFLTPKSEVAYLKDEWTLRQGIEKLEYSGYTAIPMIDKEGHYLGVVTEGDFLWTLKKRYDMNLKEAEKSQSSQWSVGWNSARYPSMRPWRI